MLASPIHPYQAVTRIASQPPSRSICAPKRFAGTGSSTPNTSPWTWEDPDIDFASYSSTGVIGNPTHASAELGAKLWEAVVDEVAETLRSIAEDSRPMSPVDADRLHFLQHSNS